MPATEPEFDRQAAQYERHAPLQREAAAWLAEWLPEKFETPVLELGAGTGLFTRHLARRAQILIASDIAPRMVRAGSESFPEVEWRVAEAAAPPAGRDFGWILSCSLAQWLSDPAAVFRAWHRAAAPGARLLSGWFIRGTLEDFFTTCPEASPFVWRDEKEWIGYLDQGGWKTQRLETKTFLRRHADSAALLREMHNAGAVVSRRIGAGPLRRALREHDKNHRGGDGLLSAFEFLRVEAVRS